jgi:hypothetical protein
MATKAGLNVIYKQIAVRPGTLDALAKLKVAPEIQRFSREELAATSVDFIARMPS